VTRGRARASRLLVLAGISLIGCTELQVQLPRDADGDIIGPPQKRFEGVPAHGAIEPAPPAAVTATVSLPEPATPASTGGTRHPPLNDLHDLIGLERDQVQSRLGDPAMRRRDAPAEIWQYRSALCVVDLFLYREGQTVRVTNAEMRPRDGRELPAETCLSSL
jgi:hypothetical protein